MVKVNLLYHLLPLSPFCNVILKLGSREVLLGLSQTWITLPAMQMSLLVSSAMRVDKIDLEGVVNVPSATIIFSKMVTAAYPKVCQVAGKYREDVFR